MRNGRFREEYQREDAECLRAQQADQANFYGLISIFLLRFCSHGYAGSSGDAGARAKARRPDAWNGAGLLSSARADSSSSRTARASRTR